MKKRVTVKTCDRCPIGREKPATDTVRFSMAERTWSIDVCDDHYRMLERDIYAWGRLAEEVEPASVGRMFGSDYAADARRLSSLRGRQDADDRAHEKEKRALRGSEVVARASGPRLAAPADADRWVFTEHALERLQERGVNPVAALWAASEPAVKRPAREQGLVIHERDGVKVVLNPSTQAIITVAFARDALTNQKVSAS